MKVLLIALSIVVVSCSSGSKKKAEKKEMKKAKVEKVEKKEEKQAMAKKEEEAAKQPAIPESPVKGSKKVTCSYGENERVLENAFSDAGGCEVLYTKDGATKSIANAQNDLDYCQEVVDRVSAKLSNAGFNCK